MQGRFPMANPSLTGTQFMIDLRKMNACSEAVAWYESYDWADEEAAWLACQRPDWLLWLAGRSPRVTKFMIVRAACGIARSVLHLTREDEDRPRLAIEAAERWCEDPSEANRAAAASAALAAARAVAADAAYAARAAYAAAYAAARAAAYAAARAYAADAAADAASAASAALAAARAAARAAAHDSQRLLNCAIIRDCLPFSAVAP
jgi:hypothetical protein